MSQRSRGTTAVSGMLHPGQRFNARRFQIRIQDPDALEAARETHPGIAFRTALCSTRRGMLAIALPTQSVETSSAARNETRTLKHFVDEFGAEIHEDFRFAMDFTDVFDAAAFRPVDEASASLDDVVRRIKATDCWNDSSGSDVLIAVVDTGIDGRRAEFPAWKRAGAWQESGEPWVDPDGHGTMCATIAAGTTAEGGRFNGVAPSARLIACRTEFFDSQLTLIYDFLRDVGTSTGKRIVATNSFGLATGSPPDPPDLMVTKALTDAIEAGIVVCFSAGNYHELTKDPSECGPTSIWAYKCRSDVLSIAACKLDGTMWHYSSRGLGQYNGEPGCTAKPDVTAPVPANGAVVYGNTLVSLENGWGTSGACPQAAGLAALVLGVDPDLAHDRVFAAIRETAEDLGHCAETQGCGMLDCRAALDSLGTSAR